jgi:hypothetical protein
MRVGVRRVAGHRRIVEIMNAFFVKKRGATKVNMNATLPRVIPRIAWCNNLIVPARRRPGRRRGRLGNWPNGEKLAL